MIQTKVLSQEDFDDPVTLTLFAEHLRSTDSFDELSQQQNLSSAISAAEVYLNRKLYPTKIIGEFEEYSNKVILPYGDLSSVEMLSATDLSGNEIEITDFKVSLVTNSIKIPHYYSNHTDFTVIYNCGMGTESVPISINQAILMIAASTYNTREDVIIGATVAANIGISSKWLLDNYRIRSTL